MQWLTSIPTAIIFNIGFMALCFLTYELIKYYTQPSSTNLFTIAVSFQLLGWVQFIAYLYFLASGWDIGVISFKTDAQFVSSAIPYLGYFGITYCIVFALYLFRTIYQLLKIGKYKKAANFERNTFWRNLLPNEINGTRFKIGYSTHVESPITFGWLDPVILLPFSICNQLSNDEIKYILLHEIAHIVRHDYLINLLIELSHLFLYFNPFSYLFIQEISNQREIACDTWVVNQTNDPIKYSYILYGLAETASKNKSNSFSIGAFKNHNELKNRILYINNLSSKSFNSFILNILIAGIFSLFLLWPNFSTKMNQSLNPIHASQVVIPMKIIYTKKTEHVDNLIRKQKQPSKNIENNISENNPTNSTTNNASIPYTKLVDQTLAWIKKHEQIQRYADYVEHLGDEEYTIAEKLLMHAILKNYQLKRTLLNNQLSKASNEFEANEMLLNSKEWRELLQYEQWTKEFLQKHPGSFIPLDSLRSF